MGRVEIAIVTHLSAAVAFLLLVMMIVLGGRRNRASFLLLATCLAIGGWAVAIALSLWTSGEIYPPIELLELGRNGLAIIFILLVIDRTGGDLVMARLLPLLALGVIGFAAVVRWQAPLTGYLEDIQLRYCGLSLAVLGLMSIENLVRNTHADRRWSIKFLALGLGVLFAYDIVLYSATILYQRIDWLLWVARGFVDMFAAPLIALTLARNPTLAINVHVSRQVVFHMTTLLISGIYLLALSLAGFYIRDFGGDWGSVLKISLGIGSAILGAILLTSGTARSRLKEFINTNFFSYKYDYRREWLRMIDALSSLGSLERLEERVIKALGDIVDSPAGGLWLSDEESATFRLAAGWNWARPMTAPPVWRMRWRGCSARRARRNGWAC
jgi:putative PEP-CTERM system histidine kinase